MSLTVRGNFDNRNSLYLLCYRQHKVHVLDLLEFYKTQGTIGFPVRITPLINIPKGFSSTMTLEVVKIGLKVSTQYML